MLLLSCLITFLEGMDWDLKLDQEGCMITGSTIELSLYIRSLA
jgi:hypothetical protein